MNRRNVLAAMAGTSLLAALPALADGPDSSLLDQKLVQIGREVARAYPRQPAGLRRAADEAREGLLAGTPRDALVRRARAVAREQFLAGQVVSVGGVRLAEAEAALALACFQLAEHGAAA